MSSCTIKLEKCTAKHVSRNTLLHKKHSHHVTPYGGYDPLFYNNFDTPIAGFVHIIRRRDEELRFATTDNNDLRGWYPFANKHIAYRICTANRQGHIVARRTNRICMACCTDTGENTGSSCLSCLGDDTVGIGRDRRLVEFKENRERARPTCSCGLRSLGGGSGYLWRARLECILRRLRRRSGRHTRRNNRDVGDRVRGAVGLGIERPSEAGRDGMVTNCDFGRGCGIASNRRLVGRKITVCDTNSDIVCNAVIDACNPLISGNNLRSRCCSPAWRILTGSGDTEVIQFNACAPHTTTDKWG